MPYSEYKKFVETINDNDIFATWKRGNTDCFGTPCSSIDILVLGALRKLGRDLTFDDLEEVTFIDEKVHRTFFKKFIKYGSSHLYNEVVVSPKTKEDAKDHT